MAGTLNAHTAARVSEAEQNRKTPAHTTRSHLFWGTKIVTRTRRWIRRVIRGRKHIFFMFRLQTHP